jgi:hypothetical protein
VSHSGPLRARIGSRELAARLGHRHADLVLWFLLALILALVVTAGSFASRGGKRRTPRPVVEPQARTRQEGPRASTAPWATVQALKIPADPAAPVSWLDMPRWVVDDEVDERAFDAFMTVMRQNLGSDVDSAVMAPGIKVYVADTALVDGSPENGRARDMVAQKRAAEGVNTAYPIAGTAVVVGMEDNTVTEVPRWVRDYMAAEM